MTIDIAHLMALAEKREMALKKAEQCPSCGTRQIQLVDWINDLEYKCRHCKHKWSTTL